MRATFHRRVRLPTHFHGSKTANSTSWLPRAPATNSSLKPPSSRQELGIRNSGAASRPTTHYVHATLLSSVVTLTPSVFLCIIHLASPTLVHRYAYHIVAFRFSLHHLSFPKRRCCSHGYYATQIRLVALSSRYNNSKHRRKPRGPSLHNGGYRNSSQWTTRSIYRT